MFQGVKAAGISAHMIILSQIPGNWEPSNPGIIQQIFWFTMILTMRNIRNISLSWQMEEGSHQIRTHAVLMFMYVCPILKYKELPLIT